MTLTDDEIIKRIQTGVPKKVAEDAKRPKQFKPGEGMDWPASDDDEKMPTK